MNVQATIARRSHSAQSYCDDSQTGGRIFLGGGGTAKPLP